MGKKDKKSKTLDTTKSSETESLHLDSGLAESPKPTLKFTGPLIIFKNIEIKSGGVVSVRCIDDKVPLGKIQIIQIKGGDTVSVYRRV